MEELSVKKCKEILEDGKSEATDEAAKHLMKALIEHAEEVGELARYDSTLNNKEKIGKEDIDKILSFTSFIRSNSHSK
jgi:hypothetical protein